jgi:exopolyphosphatase/guanosine-5'-triphosphate,3'-diphosphate pyrophosphatase
VAVANVARYHRGAPPKKKHDTFGPLAKELRDRIVKLSALLRVADGFDRGHVGAVERVRVRMDEDAARLTPTPARPDASLRLELWGASRKSALLAEVLGVPVEIVGPSGEVVRFEDDADDAD